MVSISKKPVIMLSNDINPIYIKNIDEYLCRIYIYNVAYIAIFRYIQRGWEIVRDINCINVAYDFTTRRIQYATNKALSMFRIYINGNSRNYINNKLLNRNFYAMEFMREKTII